MIEGGKLIILAGGISSRMKKPAPAEVLPDKTLTQEANEKAKAMIGVGGDHRPFLDYLLYNARAAGYTEILIVVGERDESIRSYYGAKDRDNEFYGLKISYAIQTIPEGRQKPLGTADALFQGIKAREDWSGCRFTVCNSDNLYSVKALKLMLNHSYENAMVDYERGALEFDFSRIEKFAVTFKDHKGYITKILEKPSEKDIAVARGPDGFIGVSMNIFGLKHDVIFPFLERVPLNPIRQEKEIPDAINMMVRENPKSLFAFPLAEHVPDLTDKRDILPVQRYLETHYAEVAF